jgi:hypothetical protein
MNREQQDAFDFLRALLESSRASDRFACDERVEIRCRTDDAVVIFVHCDLTSPMVLSSNTTFVDLHGEYLMRRIRYIPRSSFFFAVADAVASPRIPCVVRTTPWRLEADGSISPPAYYSLKAIVCHVGSDGCGHYIARMRLSDEPHRDDQHWWQFDDAVVSHLSTFPTHGLAHPRVLLYELDVSDDVEARYNAETTGFAAG